MKYEDTVAATARYGDIAAKLFHGWEVLHEISEASYSGECQVLAVKGDVAMLLHWSYGSCSGCDTWEQKGLTDAEIFEQMDRAAKQMHQAQMHAFLSRFQDLSWCEALWAYMHKVEKQ